jgi:hypothetical protein
MSFIKKLSTLKSLIFLSKGDKNFCEFAQKKWKTTSNDNDNKGTILVDLMFSEQYVFQISYLTNFFKIKDGFNIRYFHFIPRNKRILQMFFKFFRSFTRIDKLYKSFGCRFGLVNVFDKNTIAIAESSFNFVSKQDLLDFSIEGIRIGDLIYDTYLRECFAPTVDLKDDRLFWMIDNAISIFYSSKRYFENNNVKKLILSHGVYLNYGIIARVAVLKNIDVYLFGHSKAIHKFSKDHWLQFIDHSNYSNEFNLLDNKENRREQAWLTMQKRYSGIVDQGIFYMKSSAYSQVSKDTPKVFLDNGKTKVVLMLHCFFDAPHIYKTKIFPDFLEWTEFVLANINLSKVDLVVKPHPNGKPGNGKVIDQLKILFPNVRFIDKKTSNNQLIQENVKVLLTVYGSVSSEFSYHDVTVVTAGDNPTSSFDFCIQAKNKDEYKEYLQNIDSLSSDIDKEKILEFFYMHYLHVGKGRLVNNDKVINIDWTTPSGDPDTFNYYVENAQKGMYDSTFENISSALAQIE